MVDDIGEGIGGWRLRGTMGGGGGGGVGKWKVDS